MSENIYTAISEIQAEPPVLLKDGSGQFGAYLTLGGLFDALMPELARRGVTVIQAPTVFEGQPALRTKLIHAESGTFEEDTMLLMSESLSPQKQGGAITYARRYAVCSMVGVVADDDDDATVAQRSAIPAAAPKRIVGRKVVESGNPF